MEPMKLQITITTPFKDCTTVIIYNENGYRLTTSILNSDDSNDSAGTSLNSNLTKIYLSLICQLMLSN